MLTRLSGVVARAGATAWDAVGDLPGMPTLTACPPAAIRCSPPWDWR